MKTAKRRPARETIAESAFDQLVDSATRSYGFSTNEACVVVDQALAMLGMAAALGGEWWATEAVDKVLRLLMGHARLLVAITQHHGARVVRASRERQGKPEEVEATAAAILEAGFELHDEAWKDQEPAMAVLV